MCPKTSKWPCSKMVSLYPVSKIPCPVPRADFFEPGSKIPLPRSPGADLFETGSKIPLPRARSALGAPPKAAPGGFLNQFQKNQPRGTWGGGFLNQVQKNQPRGPGRGFLKLGTGTPFLNRTILKFWDRFLWGTQVTNVLLPPNI